MASSSHRPRPTGVTGVVLGGGQDVSDIATTDVFTPAAPLPGLTHDYFGPDPVVGPYSEARDASTGITPGVHQDRGGVPLVPHGPSDIAAPVEIDSTVRQPQPSPPVEARTQSSRSVGRSTSGSAAPQLGDTIDERFELYGSEVMPDAPVPDFPSPLTDAERSPVDEQHQQRQASTSHGTETHEER